MINDHVVRLRGLPYDATKDDVTKFFGDEFSIVEDGIVLPLDYDGRASGQAYVQFTNAEDAKKALNKNRENMGSRYVEVFESSMEDAFRNKGVEKPKATTDHVVRLRGLPYGASKDDVAKFFGDEFDILEDGILLPFDKDGRASGQAYVQFTNAEDAQKALKKNKEHMGHRYVEVFESSMEDAMWATKAHLRSSGPSRGFGSRDRPTPYDRFTSYGGGYGPNGPPGKLQKFGYRGTGFSGGEFGNTMGMRGGMGGTMGLGNLMGKTSPMGMGGGYSPMSMEAVPLNTASGGFTIKMQGIPFSATESDIAEWFSSVADPVGVHINYSEDGRPSGNAFAIFANLQDAKKAMTKNKENMKHRYVELFLEGDLMSPGTISSAGLMSGGLGAGMGSIGMSAGAMAAMGGFGISCGRGFGEGMSGMGFGGMPGLRHY